MLHESVVHELLSLQVTAVPPLHDPALQVSPIVQALPSLHAVPLAAGAKTQPVAALHESAVHELLSLHVIAAPVHVPALQASPVVQALLSLQVVPLAAFGLLHAPVIGSHVPATWH